MLLGCSGCMVVIGGCRMCRGNGIVDHGRVLLVMSFLTVTVYVSLVVDVYVSLVKRVLSYVWTWLLWKLYHYLSIYPAIS